MVMVIVITIKMMVVVVMMMIIMKLDYLMMVRQFSSVPIVGQVSFTWARIVVDQLKGLCSVLLNK